MLDNLNSRAVFQLLQSLEWHPGKKQSLEQRSISLCVSGSAQCVGCFPYAERKVGFLLWRIHKVKAKEGYEKRHDM